MPISLLESFVVEIKAAGDCVAQADCLWSILHAALSRFGFQRTEGVIATASLTEFFETRSKLIDQSSGHTLEVSVGIYLRNDGWTCVLTAMSHANAQPGANASIFAMSIICKVRATSDSPYTYREQHYDPEKNLDDDKILLAEAVTPELGDFRPLAETFAEVLSETLSA